MSEIVPIAISQSPAVTAAKSYAAQSWASETLRGYRADWVDFVSWCRREGCEPLPAAPQDVAAYLSSLALSHGRSALRRRLTAIGHAHRLKELEWVPSHPAIRHTLRGILRQHGVPTRQAAALATAEIKRMVATCHGDLTGKRDRAMLLIGYAGALRRSEIVAITREDLTFTSEGLRLHLPRSKSDPGGEGADVGIPRGTKHETCPVRAMEDWLRASDCQYGPVFRRVDAWGNIDQAGLHPDAVRQIVRKRAKAAGLTVGHRERLSPHGLRAGFITQAYKAGVPDEVIMEHSRHKDHATMRRYIRRAKLVDESPVKKLGL